MHQFYDADSMSDKLLLFFLFLFPPPIVFAQELTWQRMVAANNNDELFCAKQTSDSGYILGGTSRSTIGGDKTEPLIGGYDYWVVKLDSVGNIQWQNTIGGSLNDELYGIEQTTDGGYILGGYSESDISGDKTENSQGYYDFWIVKLDSAGNIQWQNTIGGDTLDMLFAIQQTTDGGFIAGGYTQSGLGGDKTEPNMGSLDKYDFWVVKLDSVGNIIWQNTIGSNGNEFLSSIEQTSDGGYICGGTFINNSPNGDVTEQCVGGYDYWIVKLNNLGNIEWQNVIGGTHNDYFNQVQQTSDGGYICAGWSASTISGDKTELCRGEKDYWAVKLNAAGVVEWDKTMGTIDDDFLYSIVENTEGNFLLVGSTTTIPFSGDKIEVNQGYSDFWVVMLDAAGEVMWQNVIGGNGYEIPYTVFQTFDGSYVITGSSGSGNNFGDCTYPYNGGAENMWVVKISDKFNYITGNLFVDVNSNSIKDSAEYSLPHKKITESQTGRINFSQTNGNYTLSITDTGFFSVSTESLNYYTATPLTHTMSFAGFLDTDSLNDFAFQPAGVFNDLCITISPTGPFRPGFNANYILNYENAGTTTINNSSVIFLPDNNITYVSSNNTPAFISPDSVVWNIGTLAPYQSGSILVTINVNIGVAIGTVINSGVKIEPVAGDMNPSCNQNYWEVITTGSFDPNDMLVSRDTIFTTETANPPYLDYIVRFQNTGNDTAFTVKIINPIDTLSFQYRTLQFVASSHSVNMNFNYHQRYLEFKFNNILLPDSGTNEPLSHGFVRYRMKPRTNLSVNATVRNFAAIYFDFNEAILTNDATTKVVLPTSFETQDGIQYDFNVYPNPVQHLMNVEIQTDDSKYIEIVLYNTYGQLIKQLHRGKTVSGKWSQQIDLRSIPDGVYFLYVIGDLNLVKKIVKL